MSDSEKADKGQTDTHSPKAEKINHDSSLSTDVSAVVEAAAADDNSDDAAVELKTKKPSPTATASKKTTPRTSKSDDHKPRRWLAYVLALTLVMVVVLACVGGYAVKFALQWRSEQAQQLTQLQNTLRAARQESSTHMIQLQEMREKVDRQQRQLTAQQADIKAAQDRLQAQNKRLLSLSTTTREDWLLAEAEYLLKLANQRVLIEKSSESAQALLEEADIILRDLDDPDLFALRKAVQKDLAALRLSNKVDLQGLYLALNALAETIEDLPLVPESGGLFSQHVTPPEKAIAADFDDTESLGWWATIKHSFNAFIQRTDKYVQINNHAERPTAILPPNAAAYLQQNLRLMLERAQLALLREQQAIYSSSLQEAETWVERYYPAGNKRTSFVEQLSLLDDKNIVRELPDISPSLELLQTYIAELHQLQGPGAGTPRAK